MTMQWMPRIKRAIATPNDNVDYLMYDVFSGSLAELEGHAPDKQVGSEVWSNSDPTAVERYFLGGDGTLGRGTVPTNANSVAQLGPIGRGLTCRLGYSTGASTSSNMLFYFRKGSSGTDQTNAAFNGMAIGIRENSGNFQVQARKTVAGAFTLYDMDGGANGWNSILSVTKPTTGNLKIIDHGTSIELKGTVVGAAGSVLTFDKTWTLPSGDESFLVSETSYIGVVMNKTGSFIKNLRIWK